MPAVLNNDIFSLIISHLASSYSFYLSYALFKTDNDREDLLRELGYSTAPWIAGKEAKNALLALRSTCSFLAIIVAPILFPQIYVRNMDEKSARRLKGIRKSKLIPSAVKTLCFLERLPEVMTRPGDYRGDPDDVSCYPEIRYSDPIFFDVIYSFTNLRNLNIGYEQPRKHPIIISAASDLSVGLGKYLISTSGAHLSQFKLQRVWPTDLKTLVLSLSDALPSQSQPNSKSASALTSTLKNPITNIQLPCLILEFTSDKEVYTSSAIATPLADLLAFTPHLEKLFLREPEFYYQPSLIAFRATPLPKLVEISLTNFRVDRGGMGRSTRGG
ncbi:MAG: hypothetical protein L6R42_000153 [Xanthoria sp. 1 TBL-2021]|nr:MAG: hypothetical protein L6R42_000153 [Xanthoria sp. 1 TBL-2021]